MGGREENNYFQSAFNKRISTILKDPDLSVKRFGKKKLPKQSDSCNAHSSTMPRQVIAVCMLLLINPYNISHDICSAEVILKQIIKIMNTAKGKQEQVKSLAPHKSASSYLLFIFFFFSTFPGLQNWQHMTFRQ